MANITSTEPNDSTARANGFRIGDTVTGSLATANDVDYYKVTIGSSGVMRLIMNASQSSNWGFGIDVYDPSFVRLAGAYLGIVPTVSLDVGLDAPGTYYIRFTSNGSFSASAYSFSSSTVPGNPADYESEANGTLQSADPIAIDHVISGQAADPGDEDFFSFDVASGGFVTLDFQGPVKLHAPLYQVSLYAPGGNLIETIATAGNVSFVEAIDAAGKYAVRIKQADQVSGYESGNYKFAVHVESDPLHGAIALSDKTPIKTTIGAPAEHDWYKLDLTAGKLFQFSMSGAQSGVGTLANMSLVLCLSDGTQVASSANLETLVSGETSVITDPQIAFTAPVSGTYYLMASGMNGTGSYTLLQSSVSVDSLYPSLIGMNAEGRPEHWGNGFKTGVPTLVNYSFMTSTADGEPGFLPMTETHKQVVRKVLAEYSAVVNIDFNESFNQNAQLRFGTSNQRDLSAGVTYSDTNADGSYKQVDVFLNNTRHSDGGPAETSQLNDGAYGLSTLIHEIGHALGLKHPGNYNGDGSGDAPFIAPAFDNRKFTVMSYIDDLTANVYGQTAAVLDIAALQSIYGARAATDGKTYTFTNTSEFVASVLAGTGPNTLDLSNQTADSTIFLTAGALSSVGRGSAQIGSHDNLAIPYGANIAKVISGSGNDLIAGNAGNNVLLGGAGDDKFIGVAGLDSIQGGPGANEIVFSSSASQNHLSKLRDNAFFIRDDAGNMGLVRDVQNIAFGDQSINLASQAIRHNVDLMLVDIYIAAFLRAPETGGYNYWSNEKSSKGLINVADTIFSLDIVQKIYPTSMSSEGFVKAIYSNVFNKAPDAEGLGYWLKELNSKSRGQLVIDMTTAALSVADGVDGKDFFQNRVDWGQYAVGYQIDKQTEFTPAHLMELTGTVTADAITAITLIGQADLGVLI